MTQTTIALLAEIAVLLIASAVVVWCLAFALPREYVRQGLTTRTWWQHRGIQS